MRALAILLLLVTSALRAEVEWVDLWPGEAPGAERPPAGSERVRNGSWFMDIEVPQYVLYKAAEPNGTAVVVCPGGGYGGLAMNHEAQPSPALIQRESISNAVGPA